MAAVFEVQLIYKQAILFSVIKAILDENNLFLRLENIEYMNDWEYKDHQILDDYTIDVIDDKVLSGKNIVLIEGMINSSYRFGINFLKDEEARYCINFWISTKGIEVLDCNNITHNNYEFYNRIKIVLTTLLDPSLLFCCGIGTELMICEKKNIEEIISGSKNVCMWILPIEIIGSDLKDFRKYVENNFFIYSLE